MSKTLRRPMFRGGRVSSYGTGIAHGLADGGMPPKRGLVTGPGGYAGDWNWKGGSSGITTGGQIVEQASKPLESRIAQKDRNFGRWFRNPGTGITGAIGRNFPTALRWGAYGLPVWGAMQGSEAQAEFIDKASEKGMLDEFGENVEFADGRILPSDEFMETVDPSEYTVESGLLETDEEKEDKTERKALQAMTADEAYKLAEKKPGKEIILDVDNEGKADYEESTALDAEEYFKLLGGEKARGKDITSMLLGFAGAEGDTTMEKFQKFAAAEAKRPGKAESLKEAAGMLAIKDRIATKRSNEQMQKLMGIELFRDKLAAARGTGDVIDQYNLAMKNETNKTTGLSVAIQKIKGKVPTIVQEKLPPVTVADVGEVFIVEKEDTKTKVKTRIAVEIILDENEQVSFKTLMKI